MKLETVFQDKRGMALGDIYPAVLTIVMIGIVLGIGLFILSEVRSNIATEYTGTDVSVNLTATPPTNQTTLTDATKTGYGLISVAIINDTGTYTIPTSNYTTTSGGVITWAKELTDTTNYPDDYLVNISSTYIYDFTDSPEESVNLTVTGLATFADWIAIIVVVIAAAIVLGIVLSSFGRRTPGV